MNHAVALVNTFAAAWAEALVRACWQGGLVILIVWAACRLWPALPPVPRCWLWRLAYVKLLLGLVWLPPLALPLLPRPVAPPPPPARAIIVQAPPPPVPSPVAADALPPAPMAAAPLPDVMPPAPLPAVVALVAPPPTPPTLPTLQSLLLTAWLLGVIASLTRVASAWRRALMLSRASTPIEGDALHADAAALCRRLGLRRVPPLRAAVGIPSPLLLGLGRPAVLLPAFVLSGSPRAEVKLMLAHELAHLARRDLLWDVLPQLAQRLFFFHPLVWLAGSEWALAQEIACDALAVQATGAPPSAYGRMLLGIATRRRPAPASLFPTLAVGPRRHTLRRRLFAMQHIGTISRPRLILAAALTATFAVAALLPWRVVAQSGAPTPNAPAITQGASLLQQYDRKQRADTASKNAQLDAQIAEVQKHLPAAQSRTALAYIRWINTDYAANQQSVRLLELQRADYVAVRPISLTRAQIALVERAIVDQRSHRHISRYVRAQLAPISAEQRDRVAALRSYDLSIIDARHRALVEKQANVYQLQTEYDGSRQQRAGKLPAQRTAGNRAADPTPAPAHAPAHMSAVSLGTDDGGGPPPLPVAIVAGQKETVQERVAGFIGKQIKRSDAANTQLDAEIARLLNRLPPAQQEKARTQFKRMYAEDAIEQRQLQALAQRRAEYLASHPYRASDAQYRSLIGLVGLSLGRSHMKSDLAWHQVVKERLLAHLASAPDSASRRGYRAQIAVIDQEHRAAEKQMRAQEPLLLHDKALVAAIPEDQRKVMIKQNQYDDTLLVNTEIVGMNKRLRMDLLKRQLMDNSPRPKVTGP